MKKLFLVVFLALLLTSTHQTTHPFEPPYEKIIPCGIVVAVIGGIATALCYYEERRLVKKVNAIIDDIHSDHGTLGPKEFAIIIPERQGLAKLAMHLKTKIARITLAKWIFGGICLTSIGTVAFSKRQLRLLRELNTIPEQPPIDPREEQLRQERSHQKTILGQAIRRKIANVKRKVLTTKLLLNRLQKNKTMLHLLRKDKTNPIVKKMKRKTRKKKKKRCLHYLKNNIDEFRQRRNQVSQEQDQLKALLEEIDQDIREYRQIPVDHYLDSRIIQYAQTDEPGIREYLETF